MTGINEIELPIGTKFITGNVQLEVEANDLCEDCYYFGKLPHCVENNLNCMSDNRHDHKSVVFKQVGTINLKKKP